MRNWILAGAAGAKASQDLRDAETSGRPLGDAEFIAGLERILGRRLSRGRPGPAPRQRGHPDQPGLWG